MPRISERQKCLKYIWSRLYVNILLESSSEDSSDFDSSQSSPFMSANSDSDIELDSSFDSDGGFDAFEIDEKPGELLEFYTVMASTRFFVERSKAIQSKEFSQNFLKNDMPPDLFRQIVRMDKSSFFVLLGLIEGHQVFMNSSPREQAPMSIQLAVCLDRLGHHGNGACNKRTHLLWGVSYGTIANYTRRCIIALKYALCDVIRWPNSEEHAQIGAEFAKSGFPGCVGLIDGTMFPLSQRPTEDGECYYDQKSRYSMNAQVICDHRRRIIFFSTDSGYPQATHTVVAYKNTSNNQDKIDFNYCVAKTRYLNENTIGVLKARWFFLKEPRIQLNKKLDNHWLVRCIQVCAQLHNFILSQNDQWTEEDGESPTEFDQEEGDIHEELDELPSERTQTRARRRRRALPATLTAEVQSKTLAYNRLPGGFLCD